MIIPKISVVIVTFNAEKFLQEAIDSYLIQDYENKELIVIDGFSIDRTVEIIKENDIHITYWCSERDSGIYDAMNKGWKNASGDYVLYLGSDDRLLLGALSCLGKNAYNADIVYGDVKCLHPKGVIKNRVADNPNVICMHPFCSHQSLMMKKNIIEQYGGFNCKYRILADFDLVQRVCLGGGSLKYVHRYISLFNMSGVSAFTFKSDFEKLSIYRENKSVKFPYFVFLYNILRKVLQIIKHRLFELKCV